MDVRGRGKNTQYTGCYAGYVNFILRVICNFMLSLNFKLHQITNLQLKQPVMGFSWHNLNQLTSGIG